MSPPSSPSPPSCVGPITYHLFDKVCLYVRVCPSEERKGEGGMHEWVERAGGEKQGMPEGKNGQQVRDGRGLT